MLKWIEIDRQMCLSLDNKFDTRIEAIKTWTRINSKIGFRVELNKLIINKKIEIRDLKKLLNKYSTGLSWGDDQDYNFKLIVGNKQEYSYPVYKIIFLKNKNKSGKIKIEIEDFKIIICLDRHTSSIKLLNLKNKKIADII